MVNQTNVAPRHLAVKAIHRKPGMTQAEFAFLKVIERESDESNSTSLQRLD